MSSKENKGTTLKHKEPQKAKWACLSAYEVKHWCYLFERLFKVNGISLFGISSFILKILIFLYYANGEFESIAIISCSLKDYTLYCIELRTSLHVEILEQCSLNSAPEQNDIHHALLTL